jgi:DNA-directed RNA polymerase specialized sigma24 family protein
VHDRNEIITVDDLKNLMGELRGMARSLLRSESQPQTLTPTALAISAILRAKCPQVSWDDIRWENRMHFFGVIRMTMKHALIDHARKRQAKGRNLLLYLPWNERVLQDLSDVADTRSELMVVLDEAMAQLNEENGELADLIAQHYYAGYSVPEIAAFSEPDPRTGKKPNEKKIDRALGRARVRLKKLIEERLRHP